MSEMKTLKFPGDTEPREIVDAKARVDISKLSEEKVSLPKDDTGSIQNGTNGQILQTNGDGTTQWVDKPAGGSSVPSETTINQYFYNSLATGKYDLKYGYGTTADIYIAEDGTETAISGLGFVTTDYIPVEANVAYTTFGFGYALYKYDKTFISATFDVANSKGEIREFTPTENGFVRVTFMNSYQIDFSRLCKSDDKTKLPTDYLPKASPFYDPTIPCEIDLYGDSNSYGYGLSDVSNSWANRLGSLITNMPSTIENGPGVMSAFSREYVGYPRLGTWGAVYFSAYTDSFTVKGSYITAVNVYIDGVEQTQMTASTATYTVNWGYHTIELHGATGSNNVINSIVTNKKRTFTNNAVNGKNSTWLINSECPAPSGNIAMVMFGTNDREIPCGLTADSFTKFIRKCNASGIEVYLFSPIPTTSAGETDAAYKQTLSDVISQIPNVNYIDVYKDMQLFSLLSTKSLYNDSLHLSDYGHKVLFAIAASELHLAALNSIFDE